MQLLERGNCVCIATQQMLYYKYLLVLYRPHFALDMDTKEEFFIELILSRHARKLLTTNSLRDLGLFAAHLDFNLVQWMGRER